MLPEVFTPMLASSASRPFDSKDHLFEVKWDGVRCLCFCDEGKTTLWSRTGHDMTAKYPEFSDLHEGLRVGSAVLDGEIVAFDEGGRPSFERLQSRINLTRQADIMRGTHKIPVDLILFDIVFSAGKWTTSLHLEDRLQLLGESIHFKERLVMSQTTKEHGTLLFEAAKSKGLEGIVAKKLGSLYLPGKRTSDWTKIKVAQTLDVVIGGFIPGRGSRGPLGSLLVGVRDKDGLRYVGAVGSGLTESSMTALLPILHSIETSESPFQNETGQKIVTWVRPVLECEVEYREITAAGKLRAPVFKKVKTV